MILQCTTGNENFEDHYTKVYLFHTPTDGARGTEKECHIWQIARGEGGNGVTQVGRTVETKAALDHIPEFGAWRSSTYEVDEGVLLKLFAMRKTREMVAGRHTAACMFLRVREGAAVRRVLVSLTGDQRAPFGSVSLIGRFDMVTLQAAIQLGAEVPPPFMSQFHTDVQNVLFKMTTMERETSSAPLVADKIVQDQNGRPRRVRIRVPARALDL